MGIVHRYKGDHDWEGVSVGHYPPGKEMLGVTVRRLIGPSEGAANFCLRYFQIEPGGWTSLDQHAHDHVAQAEALQPRGDVARGLQGD